MSYEKSDIPMHSLQKCGFLVYLSYKFTANPVMENGERWHRNVCLFLIFLAIRSRSLWECWSSSQTGRWHQRRKHCQGGDICWLLSGCVWWETATRRVCSAKGLITIVKNKWDSPTHKSLHLEKKPFASERWTISGTLTSFITRKCHNFDSPD